MVISRDIYLDQFDFVPCCQKSSVVLRSQKWNCESPW